MKPPLPPSLDREEKSLWTGWNLIGDREVVREAAVKGNVSLALKFLASRKELDYADVERWLKAEILAWVHQLLLRRQVFKASHILSNVGFEPAEQLTITLTETIDKELRNYIAEHLIKIEKLDSGLIQTWRFLKLVETSNSPLLKSCEDVTKLSISKFDQVCKTWKAEIATELFFNTYDFILESYLSPETSWNYLLTKENFDILKVWINVYFTQDLTYEYKYDIDIENFSKLKNIFLFWQITNLMINNVKKIEVSDLMKDCVLNELSLFGIFASDETSDIKSIISRFIQNGNLHDIYKILEEPSSFVRLSDFFEKLALFCIDNNLLQVLSVCSKGYKYNDATLQRIHSKEFKLLISINDTLENLNNEKILRKNIFHVSCYFSKDDLSSYIKSNPLVLIALILYTRNVNICDILSKKSSSSSFTIGDITFNSEIINDCLKDLPILCNIINKYNYNSSSGILLNNFSLYDLIKQHEGLTMILEYREKNQNPELPHYYIRSTSCDYINDINYKYYVKCNRPSKAMKVFLLSQFKKYGTVDETEKYIKSKIIEDIALKNHAKSDIVASCVSFLEMIGFSSYSLRILIDVMNHLNCDVNILYEDTKEVMGRLENMLLENITPTDFYKGEFVDVLRKQMLPVKFAKINNLDLPENFLNYCARKNLWLPFLIFAETAGYPLEQTLKLVNNFENENLMEHIHHALSKNIQNYEESECLRSTNEKELVTSFHSQLSNPSVDFDINFTSPKTNLLKVLIQCHKSEDPPASLLLACQVYNYPLLAVLATCYEPDSVVLNWYTWLSVSCSIRLDVIENDSVSAKSVCNLLTEVIRRGFIRTALESIQIFLPEHPFSLLMEFLRYCTNYDFKTSVKYLESFEEAVSHLKYNPVILENDFEYIFLHNGFWIVDTAIKLIFTTLGNCFDSRNHQSIFLNTLCCSSLTKKVPVECPSFCDISQMLKKLSDSDIRLDLSMFYSPAERKSEVVKAIEILVDSKQFEYALELANYEKILKEYVLNEEWSYKFKNQRNENFWEECDKAFQKSNILPSSASEFFVNCCKDLTTCTEKYKALKCAYMWLKKSDYSNPYIETIEQEIWSNYFALDDETLKYSHYEKHETNYLLSEIYENSVTKSKFNHTLSNEQLRHFDETIGKILASGDIIEALRLEKMFDHKSVEISHLLTCYELAEGKITPYQINAEQRLLFMNQDVNMKSFPHRRRPLKSRMSSISIGSFNSTTTMGETEHSVHPDEDTLALLEMLTDRLKYGSNIACRILMCYRISLNTCNPYKQIVQCRDSHSLLKTALSADCKNKLEVVSDVLIIFKWTKKEVANFICDEMTKAICTSLKDNSESVTMWDILLDTNFHLILKICLDFSSKLGDKILKRAATVQVAQNQSIIELPEEEVSVVIELLIRAHDCFTFECNMEGISAVLRKAQTLTSTLLNLKSWKLMVRLLTGIGRYTEMNYIFQILKENDQFEFLLRKGFRKDNNLKVALLKFLKKNCPKNQKLYEIVALHFTLYSEVAELFENEALEMIYNLIEIAKLEMHNRGIVRVKDFVLLTKNESTEICLQKIMTSHSHAAEYHLMGEKLVSALKAAKQAEIVALQLSLLKNVPDNETVKCILEISKNQIQSLLINDLSFSQSKILSDSNNYHPDWGTVLFQRCILRSDITYLDEFLKAYPLTNTLAQDMTRRFLLENITSQSSVNAMKEFTDRINSLQMKYRIASELGFTDLVESLLSGSQLAYLKDTVWKKGYKQL